MTRTLEWQILEVTPDLADKLHITTPSDRTMLDAVPKYRTSNWSTPAVEQDDEAMEAFLNDGDRAVGGAVLKQVPCARAVLNSAPSIAGVVRFLIQEQGRAAGAGRGGRLPAGAHGRSRRSRPSTTDDRGRGHPSRKCSDDETVLGTGLQGDQRCLRGALDVHAACIPACWSRRRVGLQNSTREQAGENRPHGGDALATTARPIRWRRRYAGDIIALGVA